MTTITFALKDKKDLPIFIEVAKKFGATQIKDKAQQLPKSKFKNREEFLESFGIGKSNPTSLEEIRTKAWNKSK